MSKKPTELPNIEDATLRACLAPLMDAMHAGGELASQSVSPAPVVQASQPHSVASELNDDPLPKSEAIGPIDHASWGTPKTLGEWRLQADDDFAVFRMVELFLAMTDTELVTAAKEFPRQIAGTVTRIVRIKQHLAARYDRVTAAVALIERATTLASAEFESD